MAISTIGTDALAASAVTSTKLASGVPSRSQLPAGTILQVVSQRVSGDTQTTSASFVTTGNYATITPTSSTSKIAVFASSNISYADSGTVLYIEIWRGTSGNGSGANIGPRYYTKANSSTAYAPSQVHFIDSPGSTSALTYTVMMANNTAGYVAGWCYGLGAANGATITLMEIAT